MTAGKLLFILSYLVTGVWAIFFLPYSNTPKQKKLSLGAYSTPPKTDTTPPKWVYWLVILTGCAALALIPWIYVALSLILSIAASRFCDPIHREQTGYGVFISLIISSFLPWWMHNDVNRLKLDVLQSLTPLCISGLLFYILHSLSSIKNVGKRPYWPIPLYLLFGFCTILLTFTAGISLNTHSINQWHHWGAYIGPAQLLIQDVIPFNEIPLQYGLGPSLLISFGCQWDCWNSLYWISGSSTVAMVFLLAYIALKLNSHKTLLREFFVLFIVLVSCLIWTALPMALESATSTPSTTGLRFLPGVLMAALLVRSINQNQANVVISNPPMAWRFFPQNLLWILSFWYSPEAGIQTSVLWFSYCLLINSQSINSFIKNICTTCIKFCAIFAIGILIFSVGFLIVWGTLPSPAGYITYLLHPPGPLPVNQNGCIWFVVMLLILFFAWTKEQSGRLADNPNEASLWIVFLLCYANFTYFIGRSADNNILNLLPYFSILLIGLENQLRTAMPKVISAFLIISLFAWLPLMGWSNYQRAISVGEFFSLSPSELTKTYTRLNSSSNRYFPNEQEVENARDVSLALEFIKAKFNEPVEIIDRFNLLDTAYQLPPWDALHGPANFMYIPSNLRQRYLVNVKKRLKKPGWILIYSKLKEGDSFIEDYSSVYVKDFSLQFGNYQAIHFTPRN